MAYTFGMCNHRIERIPTDRTDYFRLIETTHQFRFGLNCGKQLSTLTHHISSEAGRSSKVSCLPPRYPAVRLIDPPKFRGVKDREKDTMAFRHTHFDGIDATLPGSWIGGSHWLFSTVSHMKHPGSCWGMIPPNMAGLKGIRQPWCWPYLISSHAHVPLRESNICQYMTHLAAFWSRISRIHLLHSWLTSFHQKLPSSSVKSCCSKIHGLPIVFVWSNMIKHDQTFHLFLWNDQHIKSTYEINISQVTIPTLAHPLHSPRWTTCHASCASEDRAPDESLPRHRSQGDRRGRRHGLRGLGCRALQGAGWWRISRKNHIFDGWYITQKIASTDIVGESENQMWFWTVVASTAGATGNIFIAFLLVSERCSWVKLKILIREAQLQSPSL